MDVGVVWAICITVMVVSVIAGTCFLEWLDSKRD